MSIKRVLAIVLTVGVIIITYRFPIYDEGYLANISFTGLACILGMRRMSNGLAMLLGGISGIIGQLLKGDGNLLLEAFVLVALISFANHVLAEKRCNDYLRCTVVALLYLAVSLVLTYVNYGFGLVFVILKLKLLECLLVMMIGYILTFIISKIEMR